MISYLAGVLCNKNVELCEFVIVNSVAVEVHWLLGDLDLYPFPMCMEASAETLVRALERRSTPANRQGAERFYEIVGGQPGDLAPIICFQDGRYVYDTCWVKFRHVGPQSWEELEEKWKIVFERVGWPIVVYEDEDALYRR